MFSFRLWNLDPAWIPSAQLVKRKEPKLNEKKT